MTEKIPASEDEWIAEQEFRREIASGNLIRMYWLLLASTSISLVATSYNFVVTKDQGVATWQFVDISGSLFFLILILFGFRRRLNPSILWGLGPAYFAFWLILIDGYYFTALPRYGETVTYALGVVTPAVLITLPPRWFLGLLIPNHLIFCAILFGSERIEHGYSTDQLTASFLNGTLGLMVAILGAWYRYNGTKVMFQKERLIAARNREAHLAESNVRAILENIPFEAWLKDTNGVFRTVNNAFSRAKGLTESEIIGKNTRDIFSAKQAERYLWEDETILRTHLKLNFEESGEKHGIKKWYEIIKSPVMGASGVCLGTVGLCREITERKEMEQQVIAADNAKSEFLATMSHEIRTPMNSVLGYAQLLQELPLTTIQRDYVDSINNSGRLLLTIINDILDFSKIEAGKIELQEEAVCLSDLFHRVLGMFQPLAREKKIELKLAVDSVAPTHVRLDPYRLEQILVNLLSNALKFTDHGSVELRVSVNRPELSGLWRLGIEVKDTGIGIAPVQMDRLFKPFSQLESNVARRFGGTGLGLVIVERLCKLMEGEIQVESELGKGSIFSTFLTVRAIDEDAETLVPASPTVDLAPNFAGRAVLVVEDNATNRRLIAAILARWEIQAELAESGAEALEKIRESDFEVVLMDVQMPGMDGLETTRLIRDWQRVHPEQPRLTIIALTAFARADDSERCLKAGMDNYLSKPLNTESLKRLLGEIFSQRKN